VVHGNTIYFCGQVADDYDADIVEQVNQALTKLDKLLEELGSHKSKVLSATLWLKTMGDYSKMNEVWDAWIDPANPPARSCGVVEMADPKLLFEITATAAI